MHLCSWCNRRTRNSAMMMMMMMELCVVRWPGWTLCALWAGVSSLHWLAVRLYRVCRRLRVVRRQLYSALWRVAVSCRWRQVSYCQPLCVARASAIIILDVYSIAVGGKVTLWLIKTVTFFIFQVTAVYSSVE